MQDCLLYRQFFEQDYSDKLEELPKEPLDVYGRISKGRKSFPEDFISFADNENFRSVFLLGPDGMHGMLIKKHEATKKYKQMGIDSKLARFYVLVDMLHLIGFDTEYIFDKLEKDFRFELLILPHHAPETPEISQAGSTAVKTSSSKPVAAKWIDPVVADWDGVFTMINYSFPDLYPHFEPFFQELKTRSYESILKEIPYNMNEVRMAAEADPRYLRYPAAKTYVETSPVPNAGFVRAFMYFEMGLRELFSGDGYTYSPHGERGLREHLCPNYVRKELPCLLVVSLDQHLLEVEELKKRKQEIIYFFHPPEQQQ